MPICACMYILAELVLFSHNTFFSSFSSTFLFPRLSLGTNHPQKLYIHHYPLLFFLSDLRCNPYFSCH